jgi:hypothetical protein
MQKRKPYRMGGNMGVPVGKGSGIGVIRERKRPAKPQAKRNQEGMYGFSKGGRVEKVDGIMDGNKAARREMKKGGKMRYGYQDGGLVEKSMKKAMPC